MQTPISVCPHCRAQISAKARFCEVCGKSIAAPIGVPRETAPLVERTCLNCGATLSETAKFCKACGKSVAAPMPTGASPRNSEKDGVIAGLLITGVGGLMLLLPSLTEMDMMAGGYALGFIGLFVLITGGVILWFYLARATVLAHLLAGEGLLAHWTLEAMQVQKQAAAELAETREGNRGLFWVTAILFVVIGIPALIVPTWRDLLRGDSIALTIVGCYFAVIPLLGLFAWGMPRLAYRRAVQAGAEVYIGQDGVFVNGALHTWKQPSTSLRHVRFNRQANPPALEFDIRTLTRLGVVYFKTYTVTVPVPAGQEAQAENVARALARQDKRSTASEDNT